ncbi:MAG: sigma-70 family RNA polymerase sigma factor [Planctomycetes bacterium]|nr:sigma-70 family RNA polymerase sigma factor [Planctomycetota bacterium]
MSDRAPDSAPESLLAHEPWLGALARHLARDEEEAEEVVQETLRRALEAPPREAASLRSFLGSIARNFVYDVARRRRRRAERERAAARAEPLPATVDLLARLDRQRDVLDAVRELEEPFREAILLRFYEELKPRGIARRLGIPVATVKSRLRRGQERLRAKLAARYGESEWRGALAPLLALPAGSIASAAIAPLAALALGVTALGAALELPELLAPPSETALLIAAVVPAPSVGPSPLADAERAELAPQVARRTESAAPRHAATPNTSRSHEPVRWPEEALLWIDLERGVVRAPSNELCQLSAELLASPESTLTALAAGRGEVFILPRGGDAASAGSSAHDAALELQVLDAAGEPANDLPVRVLWRGDGEQRVLWRGRARDGVVHAPGLRSALERLLPRGEVLASFDFPLADVRACVLGTQAFSAAGEVPCLQAPPSGALRFVLRDPWGGELAGSACAVLRTRQPDGSLWEQVLPIEDGVARFSPVAVGAELEVEVRAPDLPPALRRLPSLLFEGEERTVELVAGRPAARCAGRLVAVGGAALLERTGIAELSDEAGNALARWRFDLDEQARFSSALHARDAREVARGTRLRLWVGDALAEAPFRWPSAGELVELGELALEPALELARGRVVDETGQPLVGALVRVDRAQVFGARAQQLWLPHAQTRTDAEGRFLLRGAGTRADRFELAVEHADHCFERCVLEPGREHELRAPRGGAVEGRVNLGAAIDAARVALLVRPLRGEKHLAPLGGDGAFHVRGLPPGPAEIELVAAGSAGTPLLRAAPCCIAAGGVAELGVLELDTRVRLLERRFLDVDGPLVERELELRGESSAGPFFARLRSDRDGRLALLVPTELEWLDLALDGELRLRFSARDAVGWVDLRTRGLRR